MSQKMNYKEVKEEQFNVDISHPATRFRLRGV